MFGLKTRKARQFKYEPRYWDQEAEARQARKRTILGEDYVEGEQNPGSLIREGRLRRMQTASRMQRRSKTTLIRTVIFVLLLVAVLYMMTSYFEMF